MSELIIQEKKETINYAPQKKRGLAKWLADHSGGMLDEKKAALYIIAVSFALILFSIFYYIQSRPSVDTRKNFKPANTRINAN